jgi:hypothetical protein
MRGVSLVSAFLAAIFVSGCVTAGEGGTSSNLIDTSAGSLSDRREAERTIAVLGDSEAGYTKTGSISARSCHHNAFDAEPTNDALTHDLKVAAYGAGADAIKITSIEKVNGLMADCWYVLEGHADTYRK